MLSRRRKTEMPVYKMIKVSSLKTGTYQRELNMARVKRYSSHFDWDIFGVPLVSMRNGEYYVVDGQHRVELLKLLGIEEVLCQIICGLTYEQEAEKFVKLNSERGGLTSNQKFHGRVESKDAVALDIVRVLKGRGFTYSHTAGQKKENIISAVACVENIYKVYGDKHLDRVLSILRESWYGASSSLNRDIIRGISTFISETRGVKDEVLCAALENIDPQNIILRALVCAGTGGIKVTSSSTTTQSHVAKAIRDIYNEYKQAIKKIA